MLHRWSIAVVLGFMAWNNANHGQAQAGREDTPVRQMVAGNTRFATDLFGQLAKKDGNLFLSPYSISTALAMTYGGARNDTAAQMAKVLHLGNDPDAVQTGFGELTRTLNDKKVKRTYQLSIANALWGQENYGFLPEFIRRTELAYGAGLKEVDFVTRTEAARKTINAWVEGQTNKKIQDLIQPGVLTVDTRLVLTNAIYFKAPWDHEFVKGATKPADFTLADGAKVQVPLMIKSEKAKYFEGDGFQLAELPYKSHDLSMVVLLPKKHDGMRDLEKQLTAANLTQWLQAARPHQVNLSLPKFKTTSEFSLKNALVAMGMTDAFDQLKADFSGMSSRDRLFISAVVHKAFVDVHEQGTEAAAATAVVVSLTSAPIALPKAEFHVNRPFLFLIRERQTGSVLFLGRVMDPRQPK